MLAAPGASAASQFTFAIGSDPDLAVDDAGTAHLVWFDVSPGVHQGTVDYCQIPRGATACANIQTLETGTPAARPHVLLVAPNEVIVDLGTDYDSGSGLANLVRISFDGGATFGPSHAIAVPQGPGSATGPGPDGDMVYGPGDSLSYTNGIATYGTFFTNASLGGGVEPDFATLSQSSQADATVGLFNGSPVVVVDDFTNIVWYAYKGTGDLNDEANWTSAQVVESGSASNSLDDVKLAGGPGGLFLMYQHGGSLERQYVVRQFTGAGFGPAVGVSDVGDPIFGDLSEDGSGRLHAIWVDNATNPNPLRWAASTAGGGAWGTPQTITVAGDAVFPLTNVAAAPDGLGFAAWESGQGGPNGAASELRAVPLVPSGSSADPCQPPTCLPAGGKPTEDVGDKHIGLETSVPSCGSDEVTARLRLRHRKGKAKVKVKKVIFRLDGGKKIVDKKPPYAQTLHLADTTPASLHTLTVKAKTTIRKKHHKPKKKVLKLSKDFYYCP